MRATRNNFFRRWLALLGAFMLATGCAKKDDGAKLEISGLGWWGDYDLRTTLERLLGKERGPVLSANAIEDAMFLLMSAVQDDGYLKPTMVVEMTAEGGAKSEIVVDADLNAVVPRDVAATAVHFKIKRGTQYFVQEVRFNGLHTLPEKTAHGFFVGESTLFSGKAMRAYTPGRLNRGLESLESELRARGFAEAKVSAPDVAIDDRTGAVRIGVEVNEGLPWRIAAVRVEGLTAETKGVTLPAPERFVGRVWNEQTQQDAGTEIRKAFLAEGYPDVRVRLRKEAGEAVDGRKDVVITARVVPGEQVRVGQVRFEGGEDTKESVLRRRVRARSGDLLNVTQLEEARYRISRLGVFDRVDVRLEPTEGLVRDAVFKLQPGRRLEVNLLAGYGTYEELRGGIEVRQYNLFGHGHQARTLLVQSMKSTRGEYNYTVPEIFGESIDGTVKLFGLQREEVAFQRQEYGGSVFLSAPIARLGANATAGYTLQVLRNRDNELETQPIDDKQKTVASVDLGLTRDRRDNPLLPRHGYRLFSRAELASRGLGGEAEYQRVEFGGSYHTAWGSGRWIHLSAAQGVITTWGTSDTRLPVNKRFFPGGDGSIRSFQVGEASPRGADGKFIGAKSYLSGSVELEQALARKWSVVVFADALGAATQLKHYPFDEPLFALGAGLRYQTLIGPIRAEYGRNLKLRAGDPGGTFLLSIGFPF